MPFLLQYNKDNVEDGVAAPVTRGWIGQDAEGQPREFMTEWWFVNGLPGYTTDPEQLTARYAFAQEAVAQVETFFTADAAVPDGPDESDDATEDATQEATEDATPQATEEATPEATTAAGTQIDEDAASPGSIVSNTSGSDLGSLPATGLATPHLFGLLTLAGVGLAGGAALLALRHRAVVQ